MEDTNGTDTDAAGSTKDKSSTHGFASGFWDSVFVNDAASVYEDLANAHKATASVSTNVPATGASIKISKTLRFQTNRETEFTQNSTPGCFCPEEDLPKHIDRILDEVSGQYYYYNSQTNVSTWEYITEQTTRSALFQDDPQSTVTSTSGAALNPHASSHWGTANGANDYAPSRPTPASSDTTTQVPMKLAAGLPPWLGQSTIFSVDHAASQCGLSLEVHTGPAHSGMGGDTSLRSQDKFVDAALRWYCNTMEGASFSGAFCRNMVGALYWNRQ